MLVHPLTDRSTDIGGGGKRLLLHCDRRPTPAPTCSPVARRGLTLPRQSVFIPRGRTGGSPRERGDYEWLSAPLIIYSTFCARWSEATTFRGKKKNTSITAGPSSTPQSVSAASHTTAAAEITMTRQFFDFGSQIEQNKRKSNGFPIYSKGNKPEHNTSR